MKLTINVLKKRRKNLNKNEMKWNCTIIIIHIKL